MHLVFLFIIAFLLVVSCGSEEHSPTVFVLNDDTLTLKPSPPIIDGTDLVKNPDSLIVDNSLSKKIETIVVSYSAIACSCAQWDLNYKEGQLAEDTEHIYLEQAHDSLVSADGLWDGKTLPLRLKVTGVFYKEKGLPKGWRYKGSPKPARIFKYHQLEKL